MTLTDQVYEMIKKQDGVKASEIAKELCVEKKMINKLLYGSLCEKCKKDEEHRWYSMETLTDELNREIKGVDPEKEESRFIKSLNLARKELLDMTLRNPLLNYRLKKSSGIKIVEERSKDIFDIIINSVKKMYFLYDESSLEIETDDLLDNIHIDIVNDEDKYTDNKLQTPHGEKELYKRLLRTHSYSKTYIEERGVNTLFITLGHLKWFEDKNSEKALLSPLVLIPISLERNSIKNNFSITSLDKEFSHNYCLQEKLKDNFGIALPDIDSSIGDFSIIEYFDKVKELVESYNNWEVIIDNIAIDCFSFNKFFMYKDLDPDKWTDDAYGLSTVETLLFNDINFQQQEEPITDDIFIDDIFDVKESYHVLDIDSSQTLAVSDALKKDQLVIQGPPGTGKSQTIVNIIAQAIGENKRVLFVSEKLAALDVVKRRLTKVGLGDACLELHSQKANKKSTIDEIKRVLEQDKPIFKEHEANSLFTDIIKRRNELNLYCKTVNMDVLNSGYSIHDLYGKTISIQKCFEKNEVKIPSVEMPEEALMWEHGTYKGFLDTIGRMERILKAIGNPSEQKFYGSKLSFLSTKETRIIKEKMEDLLSCYRNLDSNLIAVKDYLNLSIALNYDEINYQLAIVNALLNIPELGEINIENSIWFECSMLKDKMRMMAERSRKFSENHNQYKDIIIDEAWNQDVFKYRNIMAAALKKPFAFLSKSYKEASDFCVGLLAKQDKLKKQEKLDIFDAILQSKKTEQLIEENDTQFSELFGALWKKENSDFTIISTVIEWLENLYKVCAENDIPIIVQGVKKGVNNYTLEELSDSIVGSVGSIKNISAEIFSRIKYIRSEEFYSWVVDEQEKTIDYWLNNIEELNGIVNYNIEKENLENSKLDSIAKLSEKWEYGGTLLVHLFNYTWFEMLIDYAHENNNILRMFAREQHEAILNEYREKDLKVMRVNQLRLIKKHDDSLPTNQPKAGELGILYREMSKKRRHLPIRKLMEVAGEAIQSIKPVMMMSPLSIAAYLKNNKISFDLVIFDEASQMKSVDAFGAILRGRKSVVVGDSQQLPPTNFFNAIDMNDENEDDFLTSDVESILQLYEAKTANKRTLRWHYRSKDPSLIAVSNKEFYNNKLWVIPSPNKESRDFGVKFHHIKEAVYDGGKSSSRTNKIEAMYVAKEVMNFAKKLPNLSLGVAALSSSQANAIKDALEYLRSNDSSSENFFYNDSSEPFFIKPLENVQGDERDVIFISIGYGKNKDGKLSQNFGPVNKQGGERRLNVLFTRAKMRCEVFSSITDEDIRTNETSSKGLQVMKSLLCFARTGNLMRTEGKVLDFDSPFEEEVYKSIAELGYEADTQVGQSGFFIDIAVIDPKHRGKYLLGVECDGASYHSSRSARDRDRLRQSLLEDKGWKIHRIWSTDWFANQKSEILRLKKTIEAANVSNSDNHDTSSSNNNQSESDLELERVPRDDSDSLVKREYRSSNFNDLRGLTTYAELIEKIVNTESPIHVELVMNRIREHANYSRTGSRIRAMFYDDLDLVLRQGKIIKKGDILYSIKSKKIFPRDRSLLTQVDRKHEFLPRKEIEAAITEIVKKCYGITYQEIVTLTYNLLGYSRVTQAMNDTVEGILNKLLRKQVIIEENEKYNMMVSEVNA